MSKLERIALVVGGGPAPGINGVISAVTIEAINNNIQVFGIYDGFREIVKGNREHIRPLKIADVKQSALRGGSILGTARTNPTASPEAMNTVLNVLRGMEIDGLVTIGGDDTAYSGSEVYRAMAGKIRVAHVPKTIDNDLPLPGSTPTFGFETARHLGVEIVRNLAEDARTTSRWHMIVSMGRAAGHLALGIGKAAAASLTIIPEEFRGRQVTLDELCDIILGSIIKRLSQKIPYGVVVLAEGLIAAIGEKNLAAVMESGPLRNYGLITRDPHGHLRLGEIEFGRMIKDHLASRLGGLDPSIKPSMVDKDLGYELRCADPIPFDAEYTRDLGYGAVKFLRSEVSSQFGAIISYVEGRMVPLPFDKMINPETRRMKARKVDVGGEGYECARRYMFRLEKRDFEEKERLFHLSTVAGLSPEAFRERFEYLTKYDA
jgi:6-phosphofructokinase 1